MELSRSFDKCLPIFQVFIQSVFGELLVDILQLVV